jgi:hypothetical protein
MKLYSPLVSGPVLAAFLFYEWKFIIEFFSKFVSDGQIELQFLFLARLWVACTFIPHFLLLFRKWVNCFRSSLCLIDKCEISFIVGLFILHILSRFVSGMSPYVLYGIGEDSFGEVGTFLISFIATILILLQILFFIKIRWRKYCYIFILIFFLFFVFEEISWGFHFGIFNFETEKLSSWNLQSEPNLHNAFHLYWFYFIFCLVVSIFFGYYEKLLKIFPEFFGAFKLSGLPSFFSFVFLLCGVMSFYGGGELVEQVISILMFFFALRNLRAGQEN